MENDNGNENEAERLLDLQPRIWRVWEQRTAGEGRAVLRRLQLDVRLASSDANHGECDPSE
jgi:hypothetical protein